MGSQKVLLPWGGGTVISHIVGQVLGGPVDRVFVVAGRDAPRVAEALADQPAKIVTNPDPDADMLSSVRCGLRALPPECRAVLVALGDQPTITADLVKRVVEAFRTSARGIVVPVYAGRPGHPLLLAAHYAAEVLTHYDGVGLCGLQQAHPEDVCEVDVADSSVLADMDRPEDYRRALALSHLDNTGAARMVNTAGKRATRRTARAEGWVDVGAEVAAALRTAGGLAKGNVLETARLAGIQAAKKTADLIPLCHPLALDGIDVRAELVGDRVRLESAVTCHGRTGVEMEAMTAVAVAALTVYDMVKSAGKGVEIGPIRLLEKRGGKSGTWRRKERPGADG